MNWDLSDIRWDVKIFTGNLIYYILLKITELWRYSPGIWMYLPYDRVPVDYFWTGPTNTGCEYAVYYLLAVLASKKITKNVQWPK